MFNRLLLNIFIRYGIQLKPFLFRYPFLFFFFFFCCVVICRYQYNFSGYLFFVAWLLTFISLSRSLSYIVSTF